MSNRSYKPSIQFIPAALDAMITENGFENPAIPPMEVPPNITASGTISSYTAARKSGTNNG